jgi:hypothetical protein
MALRSKLFFSLSVPALMHLYLPRLLDNSEQAMVWVVDVLEDLFGFAVTSGAVGVLEGR